MDLSYICMKRFGKSTYKMVIKNSNAGQEWNKYKYMYFNYMYLYHKYQVADGS